MYEELSQYLYTQIKNPILMKHVYAVEACMEYYAKKILSGDIELKLFSKLEIESVDLETWKLAGLLHDADWELYPDKHPAMIVKYLKDNIYPKILIDAINSHADISWIERENLSNIVEINGDTIFRSIPRISILDKFLFACDELSGFVLACAKVRPNKLDDLEVSSVVKRFKDKSFAAGVNREDIQIGLSEIGLDQHIHIQNIINALKEVKLKVL